MSSRLTRSLVVAATLATGFLANGLMHRGVIEMTAWQQTGPLAWAAFSRHADLAFPALFIYPLEAFSGAILSIAVVISFRRDGSQPRSALVPVYGAALMTIGGLLATTQAAPIMMSVSHLGDNVAALQRALNGFQFWGDVRGTFQLLAFVASVWSMAAILPTSKSAEDPPSR
jgi:hypothetical protein